MRKRRVSTQVWDGYGDYYDQEETPPPHKKVRVFLIHDIHCSFITFLHRQNLGERGSHQTSDARCLISSKGVRRGGVDDIVVPRFASAQILKNATSRTTTTTWRGRTPKASGVRLTVRAVVVRETRKAGGEEEEGGKYRICRLVSRGCSLYFRLQHSCSQ